MKQNTILGARTVESATADYAARMSQLRKSSLTPSQNPHRNSKFIQGNEFTRPYVGLSPTTPFAEAGFRIDPPVSVPIAA